MKMYLLFCSILCIACSPALNSNANQTKSDTDSPSAMTRVLNPIGLVNDTLLSAEWNGVHVHYYYPKSATIKDTIDIWLIFDPAAKGQEKIKDWKKIADDKGLIWISVDDAKNGRKPSEIETILATLKIVLSNAIEKPFLLSATGLSGGSRLVGALQGKNQTFNRIILCCAAPQLSDMKCTTIIYTADEDMNCLESYEYYQSTSTERLVLLIEKGGHAWPTTEVMSNMMAIATQQQINKQILNTSQADLSKATIDYEIAQQTLIGHAYFQKSIAFWKDLLFQLQVSKKTVDQRLLNYTSLYSYSMVNNPQVMGDPQAFDYALSIYEWSDPNNNEWMFLRSVYYLQQNNEKQAFRYLEKAIQNGFNTTERLFANTFWQKYNNDNRLNNLLKQIRQN